MCGAAVPTPTLTAVRTSPSKELPLARIVANADSIAARSDVLPRNGSVVETLAVAAQAVNAGLIVSGGYGHTRLREWLFGGATYDLLRLLTVHRLLSN